MFNVSQFKENIKKEGYLLNSKFRVIISPPKALAGVITLMNGASVNANQITDNLLPYRAVAVKTPAVTIETDQVNRYGVGPRQAMPINANYSEGMSITFIGDRQGQIWSFWYLWINSVFGFAGIDNGNSGGSTTVMNTKPSYQVEYKENIAVSINVEIFDEQGKLVQRINMYDAFPTSMNENEMSWDDNTLSRITVNLACKEYTIERINIHQYVPQPRAQIIGPVSTGSTDESTNVRSPAQNYPDFKNVSWK